MPNRLLAGLALLLAAVPAAAAEPPVLTVDAGEVVGKLRPLHGVNGGPLNAGGTLDLSPAWRDLAPPLARLHDCHWPNPDVVDVHAVFPDPAADPAKPESYDFARTDAYLKAVLDTGAGVVFRLGESIEHDPVKKHVRPPTDPDRWAAVCVGVVRHYTDGWANGFRYKIGYWEIWNEPDNRPNCWTGTDAEFLRLYTVTAKALKARFPGLKVGGPGFGNTGALTGDRLDPPPFLRAFLDGCKREQAPLDFFSWHWYTDDPDHLPRRAKAVRRLLDDAGFKIAESHLNEWNYLPGNDWSGMLAADPKARERWHARVAGPEGAAFAAAAVVRLQDAPVDAANYFTAEPQGIGLFSPHGVPTKPYHALKAAAALSAAPDRVAVRGVPDGVAAAAGVTADRSAVVVLLARYRGEGGDVVVALDRRPWAGGTATEAFATDTDHAGERAPVADAGGGRVRVALPDRGVVLLRLQPAR